MYTLHVYNMYVVRLNTQIVLVSFIIFIVSRPITIVKGETQGKTGFYFFISTRDFFFIILTIIIIIINIVLYCSSNTQSYVSRILGRQRCTFYMHVIPNSNDVTIISFYHQTKNVQQQVTNVIVSIIYYNTENIPNSYNNISNVRSRRRASSLRIFFSKYYKLSIVIIFLINIKITVLTLTL